MILLRRSARQVTNHAALASNARISFGHELSQAAVHCILGSHGSATAWGEIAIALKVAISGYLLGLGTLSEVEKPVASRHQLAVAGAPTRSTPFEGSACGEVN